MTEELLGEPQVGLGLGEVRQRGDDERVVGARDPQRTGAAQRIGQLVAQHGQALGRRERAQVEWVVGRHAVAAPIPIVVVRAPRREQLEVARGFRAPSLQSHEEVAGYQHTMQRQPERLAEREVQAAEPQAATAALREQLRQQHGAERWRCRSRQHCEAPVAEHHGVPSGEPRVVIGGRAARPVELGG